MDAIQNTTSYKLSPAPNREFKRIAGSRNFSLVVGFKTIRFRLQRRNILTRNSSTFARIAAITLLVGGTLLLAACPPRESIQSINRDPGRFRGREITVAGRVVNSFAVMGVGAFEIDDGTGRLWVISDKYGVPGRDAGIAVTGRIEQGLAFGGRNFATVLRETRRRT
jgi:hypothetical protein